MVYNNQQTRGYNLIMDEIRYDDIKHDPWGTALSWMGGIADYRWAFDGVMMPEYRPSIVGVNLSEPDYYRDWVGDHIADDMITEDDLDSAYALLNRFASIIEASGRSY